MISWTEIRFRLETRIELRNGEIMRPMWGRFLHRDVLLRPSREILCLDTLGRKRLVFCCDVLEIRGAKIQRVS